MAATSVAKAWCTALLAAFVSLQAAAGCGGSEFSDSTAQGLSGAPQAGARDGDAGQGASSDGGNVGASGGSVSGSGSTSGGESPNGGCRGPEDCADGDPCSVDSCRANGFCVLTAKCGPGEKCCEGDCGECCDDRDCSDGVDCTEDRCFAGACQHLPRPALCDAAHYCSLTEDCQPLEPCQDETEDECDDGSACTSDACQDNLCLHDFCSDGTRCCPETGCAAECCSDQECDGDDDPCTVGVCTDGKCGQAPLCGDGESCCVSPDGGASCGGCCSASDCQDAIGCTVDACVEGACVFTPNNKLCPALQRCLVAKGGCALL
jgi:hypothetical protein